MKIALSGAAALAGVLAVGFAITPAATAASDGGYHVAGRIAGPDGPWDFSTVDTQRHRLFVARGDGVMMVDLKTKAVTPVFAPGARVHDVLLLGASGKLLSTNGTANTATIIDPQTGTVEATIATGT